MNGIEYIKIIFLNLFSVYQYWMFMVDATVECSPSPFLSNLNLISFQQ